MNREDVYEPLSRFQTEFKDKFASICSLYFDRLIQDSGIDEDANNRLSEEIDLLKENRKNTGRKKYFWQCMIFICAVLILGGAGVLIWKLIHIPEWKDNSPVLLLLGSIMALTGGILLLVMKVLPTVKHLSTLIKSLEENIEQKIALAWEQMAALNALFRWETASELIEEVIPGIKFDPFFTEQRLQDLVQVFNWDNKYNTDKSVLCSHSGIIHDNPFVIGDLRKMEWGEKDYYGSLEIFWQEQVKDSEGHYKTVNRSQVLTACVTRPIPVYSREKILLFGNEASPDLCFSREPSDLSGKENVLWTSWKRSLRLMKLKRFARNLEDESNFTMMSNEEFEVLFHAVDRTDEVQFRLLFTPLAQQQMVRLLNDKKIGFGDDFSFIKNRGMNLILAKHLHAADLDNAPEKFRFYSLKQSRAFFQDFYESFFKAVYFAFAPLFCIPLYQQTRTRKAIYGSDAPAETSFWEHEALANYFGDDVFRHPECRTECILKTKNGARHSDGTRDISVTAYGYRIEQRIETVRVYGQDGKHHWVDVPYDEYLPLEQTTLMTLAVNKDGTSAGQEKLSGLVSQWQELHGFAAMRKSVACCVQKTIKNQN